MSLYPSYARPRSLGQAAELLAGLSSGAAIIAGGQELMPSINHGVLMPSVYVDINALPELRGIRKEDGLLSIGALTVHRDVQQDPLVARHAPLLALSAAMAGGGRQVHNRATLGGNIVAMHPLYDIAPALLALEADVETIRGENISRTGLAQLIGETSHGLGSTAILVRVLIQPMPAGTGAAYHKIKQSGGAYGSANAAAVATVRNGTIASLRLVMGAASERPVDASGTLGDFVGKPWSDDLGESLREHCAALITQPLDDQQGSGPWRRAMAGVAARRAVESAVKSAVEGG